MKKLIVLALCVFTLTATVVGCTGSSSATTVKPSTTPK